VIFVGTDLGHLVAFGDPSIVLADGWRCAKPTVSAASCVANGFTLVPDPHVLKDLDLAGGAINTEPAIVGDPVYVSTDGGKVFRVDPGP
jgi:hypothetical protein